MFFVICYYDANYIESGLDLLTFGHVDEEVTVLVETRGCSSLELLLVVKVDKAPGGLSTIES